ncbi:hypothetical protein V5F59_19225 [Xanthobacter autotrophicus DSM 431]|uniref:hypothetical protein n=1 Tax=Xanthobacter nonsaccharivorans TaxID=3119912 RepID=UPI003726C41E
MYYLQYIKASLLFGFVPFFLTATGGVVLACAAGLLLRRAARDVAPVAFAFAAVGATTGLFMGASRDSVVGAVVPAFLTFVSGLAVYQFAKHDDTFEKWRFAIPLATAGMFAAAVSAAAFGAAMRKHAEQVAEDSARQRLRFEKVELPLELANLRKQLGLPPEAPKDDGGKDGDTQGGAPRAGAPKEKAEGK